MASLLFISLISAVMLSSCLVATSMIDYSNNNPTLSYFQQYLMNSPSALQRQSIGGSVAQGFVDMIMYGLAGIPVFKAVEKLLPVFKVKKNPSTDNGRVINARNKRDLGYAQELLSLLISVENALEKCGITEPQCQLRATCEIHWKKVNAVSTSFYERNIIKLVRKMRREIQNPRVVPLAKYVFEYYEEAAIHGEERYDCAEKYPSCPHSLDYFYKRSKGRNMKGWK